MIEASEVTRRHTGKQDAQVVERALSLLTEALQLWTSMESIALGTAGSLDMYRRLYARASEYGDYVLQHEDDLPPAILKDALVASAELDGLFAAYYHGHKNRDHRWRREAGRRYCEVNKAKQCIESWLKRYEPATT